MPNAENAKLEYEAGQNYNAYEALTDSGDNLTFTSSASLWSGKANYTPTVRPNGLVTGGAVTVGTGNDAVDAAAATAYLAGVDTSVSASAGLSVTRGATSNTHIINSITINSGGTYAVVAGTATTAFSETRGAAGGPPYIPVGSIEVAQVRLTSVSAAPVTADEIFAVIGTHTERYDYPLWEVNAESGSITFLSALPDIHTGDVPKAVYATFYDPIFAEISLASDYVPSEESHSVSSTQIYNRTIAANSSTLNQGSFTAYLQDGVTDPLVSQKNQVLWFRFYPDRYKAPYILDQGKLGISRTFPAGDNLAAACTISAESVSVEKAS